MKKECNQKYLGHPECFKKEFNLSDLKNLEIPNEWECSNCDMMNDGDNPFCSHCDNEAHEREELKKEIKEEILEDLKRK